VFGVAPYLSSSLPPFPCACPTLALLVLISFRQVDHRRSIWDNFGSFHAVWLHRCGVGRQLCTRLMSPAIVRIFLAKACLGAPRWRGPYCSSWIMKSRVTIIDWLTQNLFSPRTPRGSCGQVNSSRSSVPNKIATHRIPLRRNFVT